MPARRAGVIAAVAVVLLAGAVVLGRWERTHALQVQQRTIESILHRTPAGVTAKGLTAFRFTPTYDCLLYREGRNVYAIELCFDAEGRLIQALDRTIPADPRIGSVLYDPGAAPVRISPARLVPFFRGIKFLKGVKLDDRLPLGYADIGPQLYRGNCTHCIAQG